MALTRTRQMLGGPCYCIFCECAVNFVMAPRKQLSVEIRAGIYALIKHAGKQLSVEIRAGIYALIKHAGKSQVEGT